METDYVVSVPLWYRGYVDTVGNRNYLEILREHYESTPALLLAMPEEKWNFAYAPAKWTVGELMMHIADSERVFAYRALRFARNDKTELPGFDENEYVPVLHAERRTGVSIIEEFKAVRNSTIVMFENFDDEMLKRTGIANGNEFSVKLLGAIIAGHETHHLRILKERYEVG
jgi:hypothetical protein